MTLAQEMALDEAKPFADFPTISAIISGTTYSALLNSFSKGSEFMEGGEWGEYTAQILIERTAMAALPAVGTAVTISGTDYKVTTSNQDDAQAVWTINLENSAPPKN